LQTAVHKGYLLDTSAVFALAPGREAFVPAALGVWLQAHHEELVLPLDAHVARLAGQISEVAMAGGRHPGFADVAIAALAQHGGLLLLTCNLKHFQPLGVACADPLVALPAG
jgi:predicted nucleic acid-binding protein